MTKFNMSTKDKLKDALINQLAMLRIRLVQDIAEIDKDIEDIERRFEVIKIED